MANKFPKQVYVYEVQGSTASYFEITKDLKDIEEDAKNVAVYELKEVKTFKVTRELK